MKTKKFSHRLTLALGLAILATAALAQTVAGPAAIPVAAASGTAVDLSDWAAVKDCTYDTRAQFFAGLERLESKVQRQISELAAKRATLKGSTSTADWDFAMKEMENARVYLKSTGEEMGKATAETWDQQKDKVGQAWVRTQEAYGKVKSSTTS